MDIERIKQMTLEEGQGWGFAHSCRVLKLADLIGAELNYNREVVEYAVYLHDWGAFPTYFQVGVHHALRSRQVAQEEILPYTNLSVADQKIVAEAIELHDYRDPRPHTTVESLLVREADWLDMLGVIGIVREMAWGPNNLRQCYERILARREGIQGRLTIPQAREMEIERLARMEAVLAQLQEESFGIL
ncbi:MAG: HD domain-containing protein [Caldilineaceae bacterium]|nr:HD domain-containing protein [Caldilineaceae bacterium]